MDVSREALLDELNDFEKKRPNDISPVLEDYLLKIAKCGDTMFPWSKFKLLIRRKLEVVMSDFHEESPTDNLPPVPNVELFKFETMKMKILEAVDSFQSTPFTIQRLCELITSPKQHYKRTDKFMRGIEKNILVVSTVEPRHPELNSNNNNNNNGSLVVNGILEVNTDEQMLVSGPEMDNDSHLNNKNNNNASNLIVQESRVTVNGVPISDGLFNTDPSSSTSATVNTALHVTTETESSSEDSSDGSTDSGGEYILKDSTLNVMSDGSKVSMPSSTRSVSCMPLDSTPLPDEEEDTVLPLVGSIDNASEVEEHARQLLSQVAANIEESNLLEEASQSSSKYPVSAAIMDTNLELGFGLSKELSGECASGEDTKLPSSLNNQFAPANILTQVEDSADLSVESTSQPAVPEEDQALEVPASEMDPGIMSQMNGCTDDTLPLDTDCNTQSSNVCSSNINDEDPFPSSEQMETDTLAAEVPSSTSFNETECEETQEEACSEEAQAETSDFTTSTALGEEPSNLDSSDLEVSAMPCQSQQPSSDEPMDQD